MAENKTGFYFFIAIENSKSPKNMIPNKNLALEDDFKSIILVSQICPL
jgi:hypothetical protein